MRREYDLSRVKRGAVSTQPGKTRITIYLDDDVVEEFRRRADAAGRGYQTMINEALRERLGKTDRPVDARTLRRILREELGSEPGRSTGERGRPTYCGNPAAGAERRRQSEESSGARRGLRRRWRDIG